jgi:hypothetical protein
MMCRLLPFALAFSVACAPEPVDDAPPPPPTVPGEFGPANHWFHAMEADVPEAQDDSSVQVGEQVPNFTLLDQNGDMVAMHQFAGKMIVMEIYADRGREVTEVVDEDCGG